MNRFALTAFVLSLGVWSGLTAQTLPEETYCLNLKPETNETHFVEMTPPLPATDPAVRKHWYPHIKR